MSAQIGLSRYGDGDPVDIETVERIIEAFNPAKMRNAIGDLTAKTTGK